MPRQAVVQLVSEDGRSWPVGSTPLTIGSLQQNTIQITGPDVSPQHARAVWARGRCWVQDENSAIGTFVNGQRVIGQQEVRVGDVLQVGQVSFRVELVSELANTSPEERAGPQSETVAQPTAKAPPLVTVGKTPRENALPQSLRELFTLIIKEGVNGFIRRLPIMVLAFIGGVVIHVFLMVGPNGGFGWTPSLLGDLLATRGNTLTSILIWSVIPALIVGNTRRIRAMGNSTYVKSIEQGVNWAKDSYSRVGSSGAQILIIGSVIALAVISITRNQLLGLVLFIGALSAIAFRAESLWFFFLKLAWNDYQRYRKTSPAKPFELTKACVITTGAAFGSLVGFVLPGLRFYGLTGLLVIIIAMGAYWYLQRKGASRILMIFTVMWVLLIGLSIVSPTFADDGGWQESGGTFSRWVQSQGATEATARGIPPAVGGVFGISIAIGLENIVSKRKNELSEELADSLAQQLKNYTDKTSLDAASPELREALDKLEVTWLLTPDGRTTGPIPKTQSQLLIDGNYTASEGRVVGPHQPYVPSKQEIEEYLGRKKSQSEELFKAWDTAADKMMEAYEDLKDSDTDFKMVEHLMDNALESEGIDPDSLGGTAAKFVVGWEAKSLGILVEDDLTDAILDKVKNKAGAVFLQKLLVIYELFEKGSKAAELCIKNDIYHYRYFFEVMPAKKAYEECIVEITNAQAVLASPFYGGG